MNEIGDVQIETPFVDNKVRKDPLEFDKGAWGWLVVAATSFNFGILVGLPGNYALIYNELATVYKDTEHSVFYAGNKIICELHFIIIIKLSCNRQHGSARAAMASSIFSVCLELFL